MRAIYTGFPMNTFFISDTHFYHHNIIKAGARPFASVEEMNQTIVARWNAKVKPSDRVYHLGDVAMWDNNKLEIVRQLNGDKLLIRGNHDTFHCAIYKRVGFKDVLAMKEFKTFVCTHVPIHPCELHRWTTNVHGHIHAAEHLDNDERYFNVCVEKTNYTPLSLDEVRSGIETKQRRIASSVGQVF